MSVENCNVSSITENRTSPKFKHRRFPESWKYLDDEVSEVLKVVSFKTNALFYELLFDFNTFCRSYHIPFYTARHAFRENRVWKSLRWIWAQNYSFAQQMFITTDEMYHKITLFYTFQVLLEASGITTQVAVLITCVCQRLPSTTTTKLMQPHTGDVSTLLNTRSLISRLMQANKTMTFPVPYAVPPIEAAAWWYPRRWHVLLVGPGNTTDI